MRRSSRFPARRRRCVRETNEQPSKDWPTVVGHVVDQSPAERRMKKIIEQKTQRKYNTGPRTRVVGAWTTLGKTRNGHIIVVIISDEWMGYTSVALRTSRWKVGRICFFFIFCYFHRGIIDRCNENLELSSESAVFMSGLCPVAVLLGRPSIFANWTFFYVLFGVSQKLLPDFCFVFIILLFTLECSELWKHFWKQRLDVACDCVWQLIWQHSDFGLH